MGKTYGSVEELVEEMNLRAASVPDFFKRAPSDSFATLMPGDSVVLPNGQKLTNQSDTPAYLTQFGSLTLPVRDIPKPPR